jgi:hypothetical protein
MINKMSNSIINENLLKILNENINDLTEDMLDISIDLKDSIAKELGLIKFRGGNYLINSGGRIIVLRKFEDKNLIIPFYISTGSGGKQNVLTGKWYPFLGFATNGTWLIKSGENSINNGYYLKDFQDTMKKLDDKLGNLIKSKYFLSIPRKNDSIDFSKDVNQSFKEKVHGESDIMGLIVRLFEIFKRYKDNDKEIEQKIKGMLVKDGINEQKIEKHFDEINTNYPHLIDFKDEVVEKTIKLEKDFFQNKTRIELIEDFIGFIKKDKKEYKLKSFKINFLFSNLQINFEVKQTVKENKYRIYYDNNPSNKISQDAFNFNDKIIIRNISSKILDYFIDKLKII